MSGELDSWPRNLTERTADILPSYFYNHNETRRLSRVIFFSFLFAWSSYSRSLIRDQLFQVSFRLDRFFRPIVPSLFFRPRVRTGSPRRAFPFAPPPSQPFFCLLDLRRRPLSAIAVQRLSSSHLPLVFRVASDFRSLSVPR